MSFTFAGQYGPTSVINSFGTPLANTPFYVYSPGTTTLVALYTDDTMASQASQPQKTDAVGNMKFFAYPGTYDVLCNGVTLQVVVDPNPNDVGTGGGGSAGAIVGGSAASVFTGAGQSIQGGNASGD